MIRERLDAVEVTKIIKLWKVYADTINSKNIEHWSTLWSDNGIQMPPDTSQQTGIEPIQQYLQDKIAQYDLKVSISPEVVRILGDQAYTYGAYTSILSPKDGEAISTVKRSGKFLTILVKQANGSWKILINCSNYV